MNDQLKLDQEMDLASLIGKSDTSPTPSVVIDNNGLSIKEEPKKEISPLDQMMKDKNRTSGMVVDHAENVETNKPLRNTFQSDERNQDFADYTKEQSDTYKKIQAVICIKKPTNAVENIELMNEIEAVTIGADGIAIVPANAKWIIAKTPEVMQKIQELKEQGGEGTTYEANEVVDFDKENIKNGLVQILIDKTGLGADIKFDDEEKKYIQNANAIHLIEVEEQELKSIDVTRPDEDLSFQDMVSKYNLATTKTSLSFPATGIKADLTGLSWGEFSDITLDISDDSVDYLDFTKIQKRMSIVYDHLKNATCGEFTDFTDFLKNFAYIDMQMAIFGLLVASEPEVSTLSLRCTKPDCKKGFEYKYSPRGIINWKNSSVDWLKHINDLHDMTPNTAKALYENSSVHKIKRYKLPSSGVVVEFYNCSCYDYLYNIIGTLNDVREKYGDEDNRLELITLLQSLNAVNIPIPGKPGEYVRVTKGIDILDALTNVIPVEEVTLINAIYDQFIRQFRISFSLKDIVCPHCGFVTKELPITPDELVFLVYQRQRDTRIFFDNFTEN